MSAMLATTLRRRTSDPTVAWMVGNGDFGAVHRVVRNVAASFQMPTRTFPSQRPLDLRRTLAPLSRGPRDPTIRLAAGRAWRASHTPTGPATVALIQDRETVRAEAWGPGADSALDGVPALLGLDVEAGEIPSGHPLVAQLIRRFPGVRIPRSGAVLDALVPAILEQKVTGEAARRAWFGLIRVYGQDAPGPPEWRLRLPPEPSILAGLPYYVYHPYGVERRRADLIRRVTSHAAWFEGIADLPLPEAYARLTGVPGIGPWTAAEVGVRALGDVDAVSVGDFHLPNLVAYALAREPRGTDARMLELLEP